MCIKRVRNIERVKWEDQSNLREHTCSHLLSLT